MTHHDRILSAYPHLLPGFFDLTTEATTPARHKPWRLAWHDPSEARAPADRRRGNRAYRRVFDAYLRECAAACSILFQYCDAVQAGDSVIVTTALSAEQFDRLAAIGAELADYENDDPGEEHDPAEDGDADEEDHRDCFENWR